MATSIGGGAAQGIESGFRLGLASDTLKESKRAAVVREDQQREANTLAEERGIREDRRLAGVEKAQERLAAHQANTEAQALLKQQLDAADMAYKSHTQEAADARLAGKALSPQWYAQATAAYRTRQALLDKIMQPALDSMSRLKANQVSVDDMSPAEFAQGIMATTRSTPQQLEAYSQGVADVHAGMESNNQELLLKGANAVLSRDLNQGVGAFTPSGHRIVRKELIGLDPAVGGDGREHPDRVIPRIRVYVDKDEDGQPDTYYDAPLTVNRTTDPNDPVKAVPLSKLFEGLGSVGTLAEALKNPAVAAKFRRGVADSKDWIAQVFENAGTAKQKRFSVDERLALMADIDAQVARGDLTPAQGAERKRVASGGKPETPLEAANTGLVVAKTGLTNAQARAVKQTADAKTTTANAALVRANTAAGKAKPNSLFAGLPGDAPATDDEKKIIDFYALRSLGADDTWRANMRGKEGQALSAAVARRVPPLAEELGITPAEIGSKVATRKALTATLQDLTKRSEAIELFSTKVSKDMATLERFIDTGTAGLLPFLNKPINAIRKGAGSPDLSEFLLASKQVAIEYERLLNGGTLSVAQLHEGARQDAAELLNENMTPTQIRRLLPLMRTEMKNARDAAHESRASMQKQLGALVPAAPSATGVVAAQSAPAAASAAPAGATPPVSTLQENQVTTFRNGQRWTLKNGAPVRVQ